MNIFRRSAINAGITAVLLISPAVQADDHDLIFKPGEGAFTWDSYTTWAASAPDLSGQKVTVAGPWLDPEDDIFRSALAYFSDATGADIVYSGSDSFEQQIVVDVEGGSAPNIAVFPQPGLAAVLASKGYLSPLGEDMASWVRDNYAGSSIIGRSGYLSGRRG